MKKKPKTPPVAEQGNLFTPGMPVENLRSVEISPAEKLERSLLAGSLLQQTEDLRLASVERKKQRDLETIELLGGGTTSLGQLKRLLMADHQPYEARFPKSIPFFSEIYRLNGWDHLDPTNFVKPAIVGLWIIELIYDRFSLAVLPTMHTLNPRKVGGGRVYKHFQFLTSDGQAELEQYRDEAVALMQTCYSWYEFRMKLHKAYNVSYQRELFSR